MLFTSYLYARDSGGNLVARDDWKVDWAVGLWFVPPGSTEPRLLATPEGGMVLPLGLAPTGDVAAVWWLPSRRSGDEQPCNSGIYLVATDGVSGSQLVLSGEWTAVPDDADDGTFTWEDPGIEGGTSRAYSLPRVSFSPDGQGIALIFRDQIKLMLRDTDAPIREHTGECRDWAWAATGTTFVAACDGMTSAWLVDLGEGTTPENIALPQPDLQLARPGWEAPPGRAIGFARDGHLLVSRFYGYPTGCETPGCSIPAPAYTISTVDPSSGKVASSGSEVGFIVCYCTDSSTWVSSNGAWIYVDIDGGKARTIRAATGEISNARSLGRIVGSSADGRFLFGRGPDDSSSRDVEVSSLNAAGTTRHVATLGWPVGTVSLQPAFTAMWLAVTQPRS